MGALFAPKKHNSYARLMRILCAAYARGGGLSLQILRWGQGPLLFQPPLNQNTTFDLEHEAPDRDFFIPLSIKTLLLNLEHGAPDHYFSYPSQSKRYF